MLPGFNYLMNRRKLTKESLKTFHLGYCDNDGVLYVDTDFPSKSLYLKPEKFGNTALFPICDLYGNLVGVSARRIANSSNSELSTYVNTVYPKTHHLYGLNIAWPYILKEKTVYVVEGNVDAITMHQFGICNSVAMLASVISLKQLCLLMRFAENIILVPDGDSAGSKIVKRLQDKILNEYKLDTNLYVVNLPEGYDPDTYLNKFGKEQFLNLNKVQLLSKDDSNFYKGRI